MHKIDINSEQKLAQIDMTMQKQIAITSIFYFEQLFVFSSLIHKNMLEWLLLITAATNGCYFRATPAAASVMA